MLLCVQGQLNTSVRYNTLGQPRLHEPESQGISFSKREGAGEKVIVSSKNPVLSGSTPVEVYVRHNNNLNIKCKTDPSVSVTHHLSNNCCPQRALLYLAKLVDECAAHFQRRKDAIDVRQSLPNPQSGNRSPRATTSLESPPFHL